MSRAMVTAPGLQQFTERPSHEAKVRAVFDELDSKKQRSIDCDAFAAGMRRLSMDFTTATVTDLFTKADANGDGAISSPEWQRFCELFPTLLDCVYYRAKDHWSDAHQRNEIDSARAHLGALRGKVQQAQDAHRRHQQVNESAEERLRQQQHSVDEAVEREKQGTEALEGSRMETERSRRVLAQRTQELAAAKEKERQSASALTEAQRGVEAVARRVQQADLNVAASEERLREIERLLAEQKRDLEMQRQQAERVRQEYTAAEGREHDAGRLAQSELSELHSATDSLALAEQDVAGRQQAERDVSQQLRALGQETARAVAQRNTEERAVQQARAEETQKLADVEAAARAADNQERILQQLEQDNAAFRERRAAVNDEERPLIEQEVRLREQRDSLEQKEARLAQDFCAFAGRTMRPAANPSPSPPLPAAGYRAPSPGAAARYSPATVAYPTESPGRTTPAYHSAPDIFTPPLR